MAFDSHQAARAFSQGDYNLNNFGLPDFPDTNAASSTDWPSMSVSSMPLTYPLSGPFQSFPPQQHRLGLQRDNGHGPSLGNYELPSLPATEDGSHYTCTPLNPSSRSSSTSSFQDFRDGGHGMTSKLSRRPRRKRQSTSGSSGGKSRTRRGQGDVGGTQITRSLRPLTSTQEFVDSVKQHAGDRALQDGIIRMFEEYQKQGLHNERLKIQIARLEGRIDELKGKNSWSDKCDKCRDKGQDPRPSAFQTHCCQKGVCHSCVWDSQIPFSEMQTIYVLPDESCIYCPGSSRGQEDRA